MLTTKFIYTQARIPYCRHYTCYREDGIYTNTSMWTSHSFKTCWSSFAYGIAFAESKDSVSTPGWHTPSSGSVKYSNKIDLKRYLRHPVAPRFRPPRFKTISKPVFKPKPLKPFREPSLNPDLVSSSKYLLRFEEKRNKAYKRYLILADRNFQKSLAKHEARMKWFEATSLKQNKRSAEYKSAFELKVKKYEARLAIYKKRLEIVKNWQFRPKAVHQRNGLPPDNPYTLDRIWSSDGLTGCFWDKQVVYQPRRQVLNQIIVGQAQSAIPSLLPSHVSSVDAVLQPVRSRLDAKLLVKFYDKVGNQKVHYANIIAERAQTLDTFVSLVRRLTSVLRAKKSLIKSAGKYISNPKAISDDYLAFQFGVLPLLSDIQGTSELLADYNLNLEAPIIIAIRTNSKEHFKEYLNGQLFEGTMNISYVVKYKIDNPLARSLQSFGLVNPAEIAWEVMPWSFVFDWIAPIGPYLHALSADTGLEFVTGTRSETIQYDMTYSPTQKQPTSNSDAYESGEYLSGGSYTRLVKRRTVLTEPPDKLNLFVKSPLSWTHALESLALLVQRLKH